MKTYTLGIVAGILILQFVYGCATERFGRQTKLTDYEQKVYDCKDIELELAKTNGFIQEITKMRQKFKGSDVWAFLGDFGIGNSMEYSKAMESATERQGQLQALRDEKGCLEK